MPTEKTEAIVVRQADFSESSRVVTFFSRDFGKIATVAKGAKRLKGPFEAALDLLAECRIVFIRKSSDSLDILTEARLISRFRPEGRDLFRLYAGYYIAELLNGLTEEYDPHPELYEETQRSLKRLTDCDDPRTALYRFELVLLREIGSIPALDACLVCDRPVESGSPASATGRSSGRAGEASCDEYPDRSGNFAFWVSQGGLICRNCQKEEYAHKPVQTGTILVLRRLAAESDSDFRPERLRISAPQHAEIRRFLNSAITHVLGRPPRTLRYLQFKKG